MKGHKLEYNLEQKKKKKESPTLFMKWREYMPYGP